MKNQEITITTTIKPNWAEETAKIQNGSNGGLYDQIQHLKTQVEALTQGNREQTAPAAQISQEATHPAQAVELSLQIAELTTQLNALSAQVENLKNAPAQEAPQDEAQAQDFEAKFSALTAQISTLKTQLEALPTPAQTSEASTILAPLKYEVSKVPPEGMGAFEAPNYQSGAVNYTIKLPENYPDGVYQILINGANMHQQQSANRELVVSLTSDVFDMIEIFPMAYAPYVIQQGSVTLGTKRKSPDTVEMSADSWTYHEDVLNNLHELHFHNAKIVGVYVNHDGSEEKLPFNEDWLSEPDFRFSVEGFFNMQDVEHEIYLEYGDDMYLNEEGVLVIISSNFYNPWGDLKLKFRTDKGELGVIDVAPKDN